MQLAILIICAVVALLVFCCIEVLIYLRADTLKIEEEVSKILNYVDSIEDEIYDMKYDVVRKDTYKKEKANEQNEKTGEKAN